MAEPQTPPLEVEARVAAARKSLSFSSNNLSCAIVDVFSPGFEEFSYSTKRARFCSILSGKTKLTEVFHSGKQIYKGSDCRGLTTIVPEFMERRSILEDTEIQYLRFDIEKQYFSFLASSIFGEHSNFEIPPADNLADARFFNISTESQRALIEQAEPMAFEVLALALTHSILTAKGLRSKTKKVWGLDTRALMRVLDYIDANVSETIRLETLASVAGLGPAPFIRALRTTIGKTPIQLLTEVRISKAKELIAASHTNLSEIALSIGYTSHSQFSAAFRKQTGFTPTEFRASVSENRSIF
ncbi:AraC family transcriptional regulator [Roseibium sp. HPY-6]|uniref:helix-turn-helix domain-containing protein n=1 Tax=Roseibium sp. HPY-6 TaxID=3229852 RepID=UPI00338F9E38